MASGVTQVASGYYNLGRYTKSIVWEIPTNTKGEQYTIVHYNTGNYSDPNLYIDNIGVVYNSETKITKQSLIFSSFNAYEYDNDKLYTSGSIDLGMNANASTESVYNSELGLGIFVPNDWLPSDRYGGSFNWNGDSRWDRNTLSFGGIDLGHVDSEGFWDRVQNIPKPKPLWQVDTSTTGGGDGDWYDDSSDTIGLPDLTALNQNSISNTKFLTCYKMTPAQLSKLGDELWSENFFHQLSNSVLKPTDFIINLSLLPVDVEGTTKYIKAGKIYLNGAEGTLISQQFIRVDCGTLEVKKKWGGAIDYQTDVSIFLPFIGEQSLNANEVIGATLNVIYTVDILSGSCIASVRVINDNLDAVLYQFTGNMASNYPITSADYSAIFSATLQVAIGETTIGNSGGVLSMVSATSNLLRGPEVKRTGSLSSATGFMGIKKPYLILSRPIQSLAESYNHFNGFVSNIKMRLGDCNGFTKVAMVHLESIPCMDEEKAEIESLLKSGVLIN